MKLTLTLTLDEVNIILESLAAQQYKIVGDLIPKIKAQAQSQIESPSAPIEPIARDRA